MVKGRVAARKHDRDGNSIGLANANPILNTRSYIVHFDDGDQTELTANMIVESLYSQCDPPMGINMSFWMKLLATDAQTRDLPAAFDHRLAVVLPMERRFHLLNERLRPQGISSD